MTQTTPLAGATGMPGGRIARHLLDRPDARLRSLVRGGAAAGKRAALCPPLDREAGTVEGDPADRVSLDRATRGIDVIVSTVQGGPDVIVGGQVALADAGKRDGVRRILSSDFALALFEAAPGEPMMFDLRREADEKTAAAAA